MNVPGREFPISMEGYHHKWRAFAQRRFGIQVNALDLDANVAMLVNSLNMAGITTHAGCNGHHRNAPIFQFSGVFQGAWFEVIQEQYLSELSLHYNWKVLYNNSLGSCLRADGAGHWEMNLIYQDTVKMAHILQKHAKQIRELNSASFKRNKEMKSAANHLVQQGDFAFHADWMKNKFKATVSLTK